VASVVKFWVMLQLVTSLFFTLDVELILSSSIHCARIGVLRNLGAPLGYIGTRIAVPG
jgi:hypothetical protein